MAEQTDNTVWQEVAPGGLRGKVRDGFDSSFQYITLSERNNGDKITITSLDLPYVIEWLRLVQQELEQVQP